MKKKCFCAVIDILGFKEIVKNNTIEIVKERYLSLLQKSFYHSVVQKPHIIDEVTLAEINDQEICNVVWFSDSIFLFAKDDSDQSVFRILSTLSWLLFEANFGLSTKLRCGVSYGEMYLDFSNQIFFGQPLIDAYVLEESQEWSGGALTKSACNRVNTMKPQYFEAANKLFLVEYDVPLKENKTFLTKAINWTTGIHNYQIRFKWNNNKENPSDKDWINNYSICKKYINMRTFHSKICKECNIVRKKEPYETDGSLPDYFNK